MSKPWANEKTPATDAWYVREEPYMDGTMHQQVFRVALAEGHKHAVEWERRARHAEALLERAYSYGADCMTLELLQEIDAHDYAAAQEDAR